MSNNETSIRTFVEFIYGTETEGIAWLGIGHEGYWENGRYKHKRWEERAYKWPSERLLLITDILHESPIDDVYVCSNLMKDARAKNESVERRILHADIDNDPDWDKIKELHATVVHSGSPGHVHVWVSMTESIPVEQFNELEDRLVEYLNADRGKKRDNDFLRPPGTFNHKYDGIRTDWSL
jgi:putative DNA primase/helicase